MGSLGWGEAKRRIELRPFPSVTIGMGSKSFDAPMYWREHSVEFSCATRTAWL